MLTVLVLLDLQHHGRVNFETVHHQLLERFSARLDMRIRLVRTPEPLCTNKLPERYVHMRDVCARALEYATDEYCVYVAIADSYVLTPARTDEDIPVTLILTALHERHNRTMLSISAIEQKGDDVPTDILERNYRKIFVHSKELLKRNEPTKSDDVAHCALMTLVHDCIADVLRRKHIAAQLKNGDEDARTTPSVPNRLN